MQAIVDPAALKSGLNRWAAGLRGAAPELNALDGQLGDGDLGATLDKCAANVLLALPGMPDSLGGIFKACAQACARASGSSFGTLLAVAFLSAAKSVGDCTTLDRAALARVLDEAAAALAARGGARPGDKTMLDSLRAISAALAEAGVVDPLHAARSAAVRALDEFRDKPNRIGRARVFAEKSIGLDDPGMVAVRRMAESL
jgi:dihydroxyacetone kinase-like protein